MYYKNKCSVVNFWNEWRGAMRDLKATRSDQICIRWIVSEHRRDKRSGVLTPIKRSKYAEELFSKGAGFHEQGTNRESNQRL